MRKGTVLEEVACKDSKGRQAPAAGAEEVQRQKFWEGVGIITALGLASPAALTA
jgi:hypothetical protein